MDGWTKKLFWMTILKEKCPTSLQRTRCSAQIGYIKFQTTGWCNYHVNSTAFPVLALMNVPHDTPQ
jgi:hypothetical protein